MADSTALGAVRLGLAEPARSYTTRLALENNLIGVLSTCRVTNSHRRHAIKHPILRTELIVGAERRRLRKAACGVRPQLLNHRRAVIIERFTRHTLRAMLQQHHELSVRRILCSNENLYLILDLETFTV